MTDTELIELLAAKGMGWDVHASSGHRPGSRTLPHAWRWVQRGVVRLMVYDGTSNREWNPLTAAADIAELAAALAARGITPTADLSPRALCDAAAIALTAEPPKEGNPDEGV